MSCSWCTNRSSMVLMSLVKSPIALSPSWFREHNCAARSSPARQICSIADASANRQAARLFLPTAKTLPGNIGTLPAAKSLPERAQNLARSRRGSRLDSSAVPAYLRHGTVAPIRGQSSRCQGTAQRDVFALWVSVPEQSAAARHGLLRKRPANCCRPAGRKNASTADHARAWLQGTDRLETARDRRKPPHRRLCDHDAGPYSQGRRYRRDPDGVDRDISSSHCARRAVRDRRVLYADIL